MEYIAIFALFGLILIAFYRAEKAAEQREKVLLTEILRLKDRVTQMEKELVKLVNR